MGRLNIVRQSVLPSLTYRFNEIPVKIPESYRFQQTDSKVYMKRRKTQNSKLDIEGKK